MQGKDIHSYRTENSDTPRNRNSYVVGWKHRPRSLASIQSSDTE